MEIREISPAEMTSILPLIAGQNPSIPRDELELRLRTMLTREYRCIGAFLDEKLIGVAGFWTGCRLWCGRYIDADNVVVDPAYRNLGVGAKLMAWIHDEGKRINADVAVLDSYVTFTDAHRFYERLGYEKLGYHFVLVLKK